MLEILSMQPSAKTNRTEKSSAMDEPKMKTERDPSDADFEAAYASDAENEARSASDEDTSRSQATDEKPAATETSPDVVAEDADALPAFEVEAAEEENLPVAQPKTGTGEKGAGETPVQKNSAATSELAFAQRVVAEQRAGGAQDAAPVSPQVREKQANVPSAGMQVAKANGVPVQAVDETTPSKSINSQTDADGVTPKTPPHSPAQTSASTTSVAPAPQNKMEPEAVPPRAEARAKADQERDRAPRDVAAPQKANATPTATVATAKAQTSPQPIVPLTAQVDTALFDVSISPVGEVETPSAWDPRSTAPATLAQTLSRPETPGMIGRQMAEALQRLPDRPVELSLNPEELGRVRLSISTAEGGITVHVLAERPETLDLMRRHIDQLGREFQALGYENINFAFNEGNSEEGAGANGDGSASESAQLVASEQQEDSAVQITMTPSTGVDLRL